MCKVVIIFSSCTKTDKSSWEQFLKKQPNEKNWGKEIDISGYKLYVFDGSEFFNKEKDCWLYDSMSKNIDAIMKQYENGNFGVLLHSQDPEILEKLQEKYKNDTLKIPIKFERFSTIQCAEGSIYHSYIKPLLMADAKTLFLKIADLWDIICGLDDIQKVYELRAEILKGLTALHLELQGEIDDLKEFVEKYRKNIKYDTSRNKLEKLLKIAGIEAESDKRRQLPLKCLTELIAEMEKETWDKKQIMVCTENLSMYLETIVNLVEFKEPINCPE